MGKILLRRFDGAVDKDGKPFEILVDAITHFGRSTQLVDLRIRNTPKCFHDAKTLITFFDGSISRNHALIYPGEDGFGYISDLNSANGTWLNGKLAPVHGDKVKIYPKDRFQIGHTFFAVVSADWKFDAPENIKDEYHETGYADKPIFPSFTSLPHYENHGPAPVPDFADSVVFDLKHSNFGLMVANDGGNLRGVVNDVVRLKPEFEKRGFGENLEVLVNDNATKAKIEEKLRKIARYATDDSIVLFYYAGHEDKKGDLCLGRGFFGLGESLSPSRLFSYLGNCKGRKLVILDGCTSARMADVPLPGRTFLVGMETPAYEGNCESVSVNDKGNGKVMGYFSRALEKALKNHPEKINLKELIEEIVKSDSRIKSHRQEVGLYEQTVIHLEVEKEEMGGE